MPGPQWLTQRLCAQSTGPSRGTRQPSLRIAEVTGKALAFHGPERQIKSTKFSVDQGGLAA